ncbi:SidA/IucD/PvdA family monooxygenase [Streptomyces nigrescens]
MGKDGVPGHAAPEPSAHGSARATGSVTDPFDAIGVGFGPSNLALAVCSREVDPTRNLMFFERSPRVQWHPGMLFDGARMQISFLKDLVSPRNPASPYSFLQYTKARGKLERFVNLGEFRPTRLEYSDFLEWVASDFADQVRYDSTVARVTPVDPLGEGEPSLFQVEVSSGSTGERTVHYARNVVHAGGGRPRYPKGVPVGAPGLLHSSEFLQRFPATFADHDSPYGFAVIGGGQSAGEIVAYVLERYENAQVHMVMSGYAPRPTDNSPFVNEQYYAERTEQFYGLDEDSRASLLQELRASNYGVIREGLINELYDTAYLGEVKGRQRLILRTHRLLNEVTQDGAELHATREDRLTGMRETLRCDGLVLATGYDRSLPPEIYAGVLPHLEADHVGAPSISRHHRVRASGLRGGLYLQGYGEANFGLGDTLLSLLPFRAKEIFDDARLGARYRRAGCDTNTAHPRPHAGRQGGALWTPRPGQPAQLGDPDRSTRTSLRAKTCGRLHGGAAMQGSPTRPASHAITRCRVPLHQEAEMT